MRKQRQKPQKQPRLKANDKRPFIEHIYEIRTRLFYIVFSILVFSTLAYFIQQKIVHFLLAPAKNQQFIYTSPVGGISFLFQICTYAGIVISLPIILYQIMRFVEPAINRLVTRLILKASVVSFLLAIAGFLFGYYVGLPVALHFLSHQFSTKQIHPLFSIQEYMSFLTIYLGGSALLFQLPLVVWFIDSVKPKGPRRLLHFERYIIAGSFIIAMLMAPVPNLIYQALIAFPIILMYQIAILIVWYQHRPGGKIAISKLVNEDNQKRQERLENAQSAVAVNPSLLPPDVELPILSS